MKNRRSNNFNNKNENKVSPNNLNSSTAVESDSSGLVLPFEDAKALTLDPLNGVEEIDLSGRMAILPGDLQAPGASVSQLLSARLFYYLPAAEGILLAYRNLKITCRLAATFCDRPFAHVVYSAKAVIFKPRIGQRLRGVVSQLSSIKRHVTCILCGVLNVVIPLDEQRNQTSLRIGDVICFELISFTIAPNGTVSLVGRMCDVKDLTNNLKIAAIPHPPVKHSPSIPSVVRPGTAPQQQRTPTWLNPTAKESQSAQRILFESSSSDDSSSSSSSESDEDSSSSSLSEDFDSDKRVTSKAASDAKQKNKRRLATEDTQNGCVTPTLSLRKVPLSNSLEEGSNECDAACSVAKLEPMTPGRHNTSNSASLFDHDNNKSSGSIQRQLNNQQSQHKSSAKKRKYLAD